MSKQYDAPNTRQTLHSESTLTPKVACSEDRDVRWIFDTDSLLDWVCGNSEPKAYKEDVGAAL